jgi:hypothetical protein
MNCFPQLLTGASAQFPLRKRSRTRTVRNRCLDGREIKLADPAGYRTEWELTFQELTDAEAQSIEQFFIAMEGPLTPFTFLDPSANLLAWSGRFDQSAWQSNALLKLTAGVSDPFGGDSAYHIVNSAGAALPLQQILNAPAANYYAFSVWARADQPTQLTLQRGDQSTACSIGANWSRLMLAANSQSADSTVVFALQFPAGAAIDLYGAQVEAQIGSSGYKPTASTGGVYPNTRFAERRLVFTTLGPGRHGSLIQLRTN